MNLQDIKTKTGKTLADFTVPAKLIQEDTPLVELILQSESMDDGERQYWFNLSEVMNSDQTEKLRDILVREKKKLAEIDAKYNKGTEKKEDPALVMQRAQESGARRAEQRKELKDKEAAFEAEENQKQDALLEQELMNL